jgi:hypothetical protein
MRGGVVALVGVPNTVTGNKTFTGVTTIDNQLIVNGETGAFVTLKLAAASGQTGNLLELYDTSSTRVAYFDQSGNFTSSGAASYASTAVVQGATGLGFSVKAYGAGNSSDLQQWQNSSGGVLMGITSAGALYGASGLAVTGNISASANLSGAALSIAAADQNALTVTNSTTTGASLKLVSTLHQRPVPDHQQRLRRPDIHCGRQW